VAPLAFALRHPRRVLHHRRTHHRSAFADAWLGGLRGVEIGGAAHNDFGLDTVNVDRFAGADTVYKREERERVGRALPVDVVAPAHRLPFAGSSFDFVLSSHVIEHVPDPVAALREWARVASRYVLVVVPHRDRTFDRDRPLTPVAELLSRHAAGLESAEDRHWSVWTCESFRELCAAIALPVLAWQDPDDKTGSGFAVVLDAAA